MFNAKEEVKRIVKFVKNYYKNNNLKGAVIGVSGGKDSAVVAAIMVKALGKGNVVGVTLPCHSNEQDMIDAKKLSEEYGFKLYNIDLTSVYDQFLSNLDLDFDIKNYDFDSNLNLKPRLRMASLYYLAQLMSAYKKSGYIVVGTTNLPEKFVGYFTKGADSVHDLSVIGNLTVEEVILIGKELGVPEEILYKTPHDGLSVETDEEKLGVLYRDVAKFINNEVLDQDITNKIINLHQRNLHKLIDIPTYKKQELAAIVSTLRVKQQTISLMESCTGGSLAAEFTNIAGVSDVFKYSAVTYSSDSKIAMGVDADIISKYGIYSKEVARAMAKSIASFVNSDYSIGITGKLDAYDQHKANLEDHTVYISIYDRSKNVFLDKVINVNKITRVANKQDVIRAVIQAIDAMVNEKL